MSLGQKLPEVGDILERVPEDGRCWIVAGPAKPSRDNLGEFSNGFWCPYQTIFPSGKVGPVVGPGHFPFDRVRIVSPTQDPWEEADE